jgi:hypothetical protein
MFRVTSYGKFSRFSVAIGNPSLGEGREKKVLERESVHGQKFTSWVIAKRMIGTCNLQVKAVRV